ncbi:BQ2448_7040 [Microbotryum intermedium]|uniref:BQ2448_7040 protein n=1 Tax=Microbotryum intermedium TaxID=269621 RepID=A0A238FIY4_9BASI|nr:BQ2448_7040 [Microbotryum intermedium]
MGGSTAPVALSAGIRRRDASRLTRAGLHVRPLASVPTLCTQLSFPLPQEGPHRFHPCQQHSTSMVHHVPDTSSRSWTLGGGSSPSPSSSPSSSPRMSPSAIAPSSFISSTPMSNGHLGRSVGASGSDRKGKTKAKEAYGQGARQHVPQFDRARRRRRHAEGTASSPFPRPSCQRADLITPLTLVRSVPIQHLPTELLSHVFAHLSPSSLNAAQLVCQRWNEVISDEASWRSAFETYYGLVAPNGSVSLGRRIEPTSWKAEYRSRVLLLHRWCKSRTPALTHNPNIGPLSSMHINLPYSKGAATGSSSPRTPPAVLSPVLLSLSEQLGSATHSIPFTGKVTRGTLHATPVDNLGRPFGFAPVPVTSSVISPDGTRILFGMADGTIRIVSCGTTGRGVVAGVGERGEMRAIDNAHREGTDVVALPFGRSGPRTRSDVFVSVGQDGLVVVWQLSSNSNARDWMAPAVKIWSTRVDAAIPATGMNDARPGPEPPKVTAVAFDPGWSGKQSRLAAIALGLSTSAVLCWTKVDLESRDVQAPVETLSFHELESLSTNPIDALHFDHTPLHNSHRLLVHATGRAEFLRYSFADVGSSPPACAIFAHPFKHLGHLTAFAFDFDEPPASLLLGHSTPREGRITGFTPNDPSTPVHEDLPTSSSKASLASLAESAASLLQGSSSFGRRKFVVAGDASGCVHAWDWDVNATEPNVDAHRTVPTSDSRVTALELTEAMLFVGSLDGTVRCYDSLTSSLLRTLKDRTAPRMPARMLAAGQIDANDEERWSVSHIRASREAVVAAVDNRVLAWRIAADLGKKKLKGVAGAGGKMSARTERFRSGMELRSEIKESIDSLSNESIDRVQRLTHEHRIAVNFGVPSSLDDMTEDEAVDLALMLSAEEEEARWFTESAASSAVNSPAFEPIPEELLDMEGLSLDDSPDTYYERPSQFFGNWRPSSSLAHEWDDDEDDDDEEDHSPRPRLGPSRSLSLSVPTSPTLRGSSLSNGSPSPSSRSASFTWRPASHSPQHASPSFSSYHLSSTSPHAKVQLSPRLGPTYGSATNRGFPPTGPVPDMSADLWPVASSSTSPSPTPSGQATSKGNLSPAPSPAPATPASSTTTKRGWNVVARAGSTSASPYPSPSPLHPSSRSTSSMFAASQQGRTSLLTEQLRGSTSTSADLGLDGALTRGIQQSREEEMRRREEEDLRFAIELSMAEEASRK